jgi:hypothetical protein
MSPATALELLPPTIKIGAYDWSVKVEYGAVDTSSCGEADFETHTVSLWLHNLTSPNHTVGTVLHECLHVIFENEKLGKLKKDKEAREEQIVSGMETGVVSLLRDNPKLLTWIKKCLK